MTPLQRFAVATDGGLDALPGLKNDVPVAPFSVNFGNRTYHTFELSTAELLSNLKSSPTHPTSSQPSPQEWAAAFRAAAEQGQTYNILAIAISTGLSGSLNAARQAAALVPDLHVTFHDSRTLSTAQAFQVHAAQTAALLGLPLETALSWMKTVHEQTELYFTIDTLEYLRRGGRIGRVAAMLGGLLNLKPVVSVDKTTGTYVNLGRARSYKGGMEALVQQVDRRFGAGTPLRVGALHGSVPEDASTVLDMLRSSHPLLLAEAVTVNPVLHIHTGPRGVGLAAAPGPWPWER